MENIYANNAGTTWPKAPGVIEASSAALAGPPEASWRWLQAARDEVCIALGIAQPERLLLTGGCTSALGLLLGDLPLQDGDVVLTSSLEHHALMRPLQQLALTRGIVLDVSPYSPDAPFDLEYARRLLRGGRVRLVAVSGASNVTGELLPVAEIGALAHEHGALLLLDAAQTMGVSPLDLRSLPVDMLAFAGHKGPLAVHGVGGLWAAPSVEFQSPAAVCEIDRAGDLAEAGRPHCASFPGDCDAGSASFAAAAGLAVALRWRRAQAGDPYRTARTLTERLRTELRAVPHCQIFAGLHTPHTAATSVRIDGLPLARAEAYFASRGISVRAGQHCAPFALRAIGAPEGTVRISFGPFNRESDVDAIVAAVRDVAPGDA